MNINILIKVQVLAQHYIKWMNELLLFNANSAIFQLYLGENKLIFNEMMVASPLST
jgi:hypothetical protein